MSEEQVKKTPGGYHYSLDLGDGHWLEWSTYADRSGEDESEKAAEVIGGIIIHTYPGMPNGECQGAFWLRGNVFNQLHNRQSPEWDISGPADAPTLHPSFLCHCGDHGWVRNGKWVRA